MKAWSPVELATLRVQYPHMQTKVVALMLERPVAHVYATANRMGLKKAAEYLSTPAAGRLRPGDRRGANYQFAKGIVPWNKGTNWKAGGRSVLTQFKPGVRQGVAAKLWKPVGTERLSKDGYLERKVNDGLPLQRRWRAVHLIVWEAAHGPLPKGHAVSFKNGDKRDVSLGNLFLVTRADLMRRNTVHNYPQPIPQLVQLRGALQRQINRRQGNGRKED